MAGDLRNELGAPAFPDVPAFRMAIPEGWEAHSLSPETEQKLISGASSRLMQLHRPDLAAEMRAIAQQSFRQLRAEKGFMVIAPGPSTPEPLFIPTALHGVVRGQAPGFTLDQVVKTAARKHGARPLDANSRIAAWRQSGTISVLESPVMTTTAVYLIPIPGTQRKRALQLTAAISHPEERDADDQLLETWFDVLDAHVATFTWEQR